MSREYEEYNTEIIKQREKERDLLGAKYLEAKSAIIDSKDMIQLARLVKSYHAGDSPEKAVYILAQATMLINKIVEPFAIIELFEEKKRNIEAIKNQLSK